MYTKENIQTQWQTVEPAFITNRVYAGTTFSPALHQGKYMQQQTDKPAFIQALFRQIKDLLPVVLHSVQC